jgi:hypothetical protein
MVALSSSSTASSSNSIDSPTYLKLPSLEEILEDAQSHFPRFLFGFFYYFFKIID